MEQSFGSYLKQLREERGWSMNQLAQVAEISGSQISRIESGLRGIPKPQTIRKFADALDGSYEELMKRAGYLETGKNPKSNTDMPVPDWATYKDKRDFKRMLEDDGELMFDGIPLDQEDKQRIKDVLTGLFWEAKQMNKRTKKR